MRGGGFLKYRDKSKISLKLQFKSMGLKDILKSFLERGPKCKTDRAGRNIFIKTFEEKLLFAQNKKILFGQIFHFFPMIKYFMFGDKFSF